MAARELRHRFLAETARARGCGSVALAHQQDDQIELFFLRLLRGAGNEGLAGMKWRNPSPADARVRLARPLLGQSRSWILARARARGIPSREDASNAAQNIPRNRIRGILLPMLEEWQPGLRETAARCMEIASAEADLSASLAREWLAGGQKAGFEHLPVAVARRCLEFQLVGMGIAANFDLVEFLRLNPGKIITASAGRRFSRRPSGGIHEIPSEDLGFDSSSLAVSLEGPFGQTSFAGLEIAWRKADGAPDTFPDGRDNGIEHLDCDLVGAEIVVRHWQPGDRFQPSGLARAKKLQDLFSDLKIPRTERRRRVVAATLDGALFWVEGLRVGEAFKIHPATKTSLEWRWQRPKTPIAGLLQEC
jgi:tRNA(Ile)-lysidine synthase